MTDQVGPLMSLGPPSLTDLLHLPEPFLNHILLTVETAQIFWEILVPVHIPIAVFGQCMRKNIEF